MPFFFTQITVFDRATRMQSGNIVRAILNADEVKVFPSQVEI